MFNITKSSSPACLLLGKSEHSFKCLPQNTPDMFKKSAPSKGKVDNDRIDESFQLDVSAWK